MPESILAWLLGIIPNSLIHRKKSLKCCKVTSSGLMTVAWVSANCLSLSISLLYESIELEDSDRSNFR